MKLIITNNDRRRICTIDETSNTYVIVTQVRHDIISEHIAVNTITFEKTVYTTRTTEWFDESQTEYHDLTEIRSVIEQALIGSEDDAIRQPTQKI